MPRRPPKKSLLVAGAVVVLAAVVLIGAGFVSGKRGGRSSRVTLTDSRGQRWEIALVASPTRVAPGAPVKLKLSIARTTDKAQSISFPSNRQVELVARDDKGKEVWRSAEPSVQFDLSIPSGGTRRTTSARGRLPTARAGTRSTG